MKKIFLLLISIMTYSQIQAQDLLYIPCEDIIEISSYQNDSELIVNFFGDRFIIATSETKTLEKAIILDHAPWTNGYNYSIIYFNKEEKTNYISNLSESTTVCYKSEEYLIIKHLPSDIYPAINDGTIRITENRAHLAKVTKKTKERYKIEEIKEVEPFIQSLIDEINIVGIQEIIQHLENYGTRFYNKPQAFEAEQWIKEQFVALGLETEIHTFPEPGSSGNIIAVQQGTLYPNEFVVCGAHYDSYNNNGDFDEAPGADDNATGVASIIEAARILSQYEFDRSIIYCAWSAEEIGLIGSQYYAQDAAAEELDILGYFNLDMTGYLDPSQEFKFVMHYSHNSEILRDYYINMANMYYPDTQIDMTFSSWGSDYASFANNGYMGVSQNEDWSHANPHYHSPTDIIGPSVNNFEQVETYAGLNIASIASLAGSLAILPISPENLIGIKGNQEVFLSWDSINNNVLQYNIYRDDEIIQSVASNINTFTDTNLENETLYTYYVTASYVEDLESGPSNSVEVVPMETISFPFFTDFEDFKALYWNFSEGWGLASNASYSPIHSLSDCPSGFYQNNSHTTCSLDPIDLPNSSNCYIEFQLKHHLNENGEGDFVYLEARNENEEQWVLLDTYSGTQLQWTLKSYPLDQFDNQKLLLRFRLNTDDSGQDFGIFVDDFKIDFHTTIEEKNNLISIYPNPVSDVLYVNSITPLSSAILINSLGQTVLKIPMNPFQNQIDISSIDEGIYFIQIERENEHPLIIKFIKLKFN